MLLPHCWIQNAVFLTLILFLLSSPLLLLYFFILPSISFPISQYCSPVPGFFLRQSFSLSVNSLSLFSLLVPHSQASDWEPEMYRSNLAKGGESSRRERKGKKGMRERGGEGCWQRFFKIMCMTERKKEAVWALKRTIKWSQKENKASVCTGPEVGRKMKGKVYICMCVGGGRMLWKRAERKRVWLGGIFNIRGMEGENKVGEKSLEWEKRRRGKGEKGKKGAEEETKRLDGRGWS